MSSPNQGQSLKRNNNPCQDITEQKVDQEVVLRLKSRQELYSQNLDNILKKISQTQDSSEAEIELNLDKGEFHENVVFPTLSIIYFQRAIVSLMEYFG